MHTPVVTVIDQMREILVPRECVNLCDDVPEECEHADTSMLDFSFLEELDIDVFGDV